MYRKVLVLFLTLASAYLLSGCGPLLTSLEDVDNKDESLAPLSLEEIQSVSGPFAAIRAYIMDIQNLGATLNSALKDLSSQLRGVSRIVQQASRELRRNPSNAVALVQTAINQLTSLTNTQMPRLRAAIATIRAELDLLATQLGSLAIARKTRDKLVASAQKIILKTQAVDSSLAQTDTGLLQALTLLDEVLANIAISSRTLQKVTQLLANALSSVGKAMSLSKGVMSALTSLDRSVITEAKKAGGDQISIPGSISLPPQAPIQPQELQVISATSIANVDAQGRVSAAGLWAINQILAVTTSSGTVALLSYVFFEDGIIISQVPNVLKPFSVSALRGTIPSGATSGGNVVEFSPRSTALALIMINPLLMGSGPGIRLHLAELALQHNQFSQLVSAIENALTVDPETALNEEVHPEIYELAARISEELFSSLSNSATVDTMRPLAPDLQPYPNNLIQPWLQDDVGTRIVIKNRKAIYYVAAIKRYKASDNPWRILIERHRLFQGLNPIPQLQPVAVPVDIGYGRFEVKIYKGIEYLQGDRNQFSEFAFFTNLGALFLQIADIILALTHLPLPSFDEACARDVFNHPELSAILIPIIEQWPNVDLGAVLRRIIGFFTRHADTIFFCFWRNAVDPEKISELHRKVDGILSGLSRFINFLAWADRAHFFVDLIIPPSIPQPFFKFEHQPNFISYIPDLLAGIISQEGLTVHFRASGYDPDPDENRDLRYQWDFGDGGFSTEQNPSHTYAAPGTYRVKARVSDPDGSWEEAVLTVEVSSGNQSPIAVLEATPRSGVAPLQVLFDGSGSSDPDGHIVSYEWDFGDGTQLITTTPTTNHIYGVAGTYNAGLTVRDNQGATSIATVQITVTGSAINDVRITLTWNKKVDMDLHITGPTGEQIDYEQTMDSRGGELDHDIMCGNIDQFGDGPYQENITWQAGEAWPGGPYSVGVNYYSPCTDSGPVEVVVRVKINEGAPNEISREFGPFIVQTNDHNCSGSCNENAWWKVTDFDYPNGNFRPVSRTLPLGQILREILEENSKNKLQKGE